MTSTAAYALGGALLGAVISGLMVLLAQWYQGVRERRSAVRALLVEMTGNAKAARMAMDVARVAGNGTSRPESAVDWEKIQGMITEQYSTHVWTNELPLLADRLTWMHLAACMEAYSYAQSYIAHIKEHGNGIKFLDKAFSTCGMKFLDAASGIQETSGHCRYFSRGADEAFKRTLTEVRRRLALPDDAPP